MEVPRGDAVHEHDGRAFVRVGRHQTRRLRGEERLRLAQNRAQSRYLWFDKQVVPGTGFETLAERLWEPLLSVQGETDPRRGLMNLRLLAQDDVGVDRATVAGILLCTHSPQDWLSHATIVATHYRGADRASGQLDAQKITGPLPGQIADAVQFVVRNMRVAARKTPEREDLPQYSKAAVFEAHEALPWANGTCRVSEPDPSTVQDLLSMVDKENWYVQSARPAPDAATAKNAQELALGRSQNAVPQRAVQADRLWQRGGHPIPRKSP